MKIILNTWGQKLKTAPIETSFISNTIIDATKIPNGIYYLSIDNIAKTKPVKFIKIR